MPTTQSTAKPQAPRIDPFDALPDPSGYEERKPLNRPTGRDAVSQCNEMGIAVGDVIVGREAGAAWWHETELTLLWLGETTAVWRCRRRNKGCPAWRDDGESAAWGLNSRRWHRVAQI